MTNNNELNETEILNKLIEIANGDLSILQSTTKDPDTYKDFWKMCEDIREHAKNNGYAIESQDYPRELKLGYHCKNTDKVWKIRIADLAKSLNEHTDQAKADTIKKCLQTNEGKIKLAESMNKV